MRSRLAASRLKTRGIRPCSIFAIRTASGPGSVCRPSPGGHFGWLATLNAFEQQGFQFLLRRALFVVGDQISNVFGYCAVAPEPTGLSTNSLS